MTRAGLGTWALRALRLWAVSLPLSAYCFYTAHGNATASIEFAREATQEAIQPGHAALAQEYRQWSQEALEQSEKFQELGTWMLAVAPTAFGFGLAAVWVWRGGRFK